MALENGHGQPRHREIVPTAPAEVVQAPPDRHPAIRRRGPRRDGLHRSTLSRSTTTAFEIALLFLIGLVLWRASLDDSPRCEAERGPAAINAGEKKSMATDRTTSAGESKKPDHELSLHL